MDYGITITSLQDRVGSYCVMTKTENTLQPL